MRVVRLLVGFSVFLLTVVPAAVKPPEVYAEWDRDGGRGDWGQNDRGPWGPGNGGWGQGNRGPWDNGNGGPWGQGGYYGRRGVFQDRSDGLSDDQADALSDKLQDCVSTRNLKDMRLREISQLVDVVGLTTRERRRIQDIGDLSDALEDHLDANDVQDMKLRQILQVARACGLSDREVFEIFRNR